MKLLWGTILKRARSRPDCINSSHVAKIWKELYTDDKYSHICNYEKEIMDKVEKSLNKYSKKMKHKQLSGNENIEKINTYPVKTENEINSNNNSSTSSPSISGCNNYSPLMKNNMTQIYGTENPAVISNYNEYKPTDNTNVSHIPSPLITVPVEQYNNVINNNVINNTIPVNPPLSPVSNCSPISYDDNRMINAAYTQPNIQTVVYQQRVTSSPQQIPQIPHTSPQQITQIPNTTTQQINQIPNAKVQQITQIPSTTAQQIAQIPNTTAQQITQIPITTAQQITQITQPIIQPPTSQIPQLHNCTGPINYSSTTNAIPQYQLPQNNTTVQYSTYNSSIQYNVTQNESQGCNSVSIKKIASPTEIQYQQQPIEYQYSQPIINYNPQPQQQPSSQQNQQTIIYYRSTEQPNNKIVINNNNNNIYYSN